MVELANALSFVGSPVGLAPAIGAQLGDSRVANSHDATKRVVRNFGLTYWLNILGGGAYELPGDLNFGVSGDNTSQILARFNATVLPTMLAQRVRWLLLMGGTNNPGDGISLSDAKAHFTEIAGKCEAAGIRLVIVAETPRGDTTFTAQRFTDANLKYHDTLRDWLLRYLPYAYPNVLVHDPYPAMADPATTTGDAIVGMLYDGLHPSPLGARAIATGLHNGVLSKMFPAVNRLITTQANAWHATDRPFGALNTNPLLVGTGGTLGGASGQLADGWTAAVPTGVTAVLSKGTEDGYPTQIITLSGTPTTASPVMEIYSNGVTLTNWVSGTQARATGVVKADPGGSGYLAAELYLRGTYPTGGTINVESGNQGSLTSLPAALLTDGFGGVNITPPVGAGAAGAPTLLRTRVLIWLIQNVAVSASFKVRQVAVQAFPGYGLAT